MQTHAYGTGAPDIAIPVVLSIQSRSVRILSKIDTGAQNCIFQREHGEALGLNIEAGEQKEFKTAAGRFWTFGHEVTMTCLGYQHQAVVYFARETEFPRNVLGREGWLQRFRVGLIDYDGLLYLSAYDE